MMPNALVTTKQNGGRQKRMRLAGKRQQLGPRIRNRSRFTDDFFIGQQNLITSQNIGRCRLLACGKLLCGGACLHLRQKHGNVTGRQIFGLRRPAYGLLIHHHR